MATARNDLALARKLKALSHPVRLGLLRRLARTSGCCGDLVSGIGRAQSTVSQHLLMLKEAGLVAGHAQGSRSCYCLNAAALAALRAEIDSLLGELSGDSAGEPARCETSSAAGRQRPKAEERAA